MTVTIYRECLAEGCGRPTHARRLCKMHYKRQSRNQQPLPPSFAAGNEDAFWVRVCRGEGCWEWAGSKTAAGYGNLRLPSGANGYAHRVSFELTRGPIPAGMVLDHLCRNRACVNPEHLEPVSQLENVRRGASAYGEIKKSCPRGHDMTDATNVYTRPSGYKVCRHCASAQNDKRRVARQGARRG